MKARVNARRGFLGAALVTPLAAAASPVLAGGEDAELIALAARVVEAHRAYRASYEPDAQSIAEEKAREAEQDRLWDIAADLALELMPMVPTTFAGFQAKARAVYEMAEKELDGSLCTSGISDKLTASLLANLAGRPFAAME